MPTSDTRLSDVDTATATSCILYLLFAFLGAVWLLFDTWIDAHTLPVWAGYNASRLERLGAPGYHIVVTAVAGGAIGGVVNGIRSALRFSASFDGRFAWKYISAPWMGAALALVTYALVATTATVMGGEVPSAQANSSQLLSNFAVGALAGYGARDVFIWLDAKVHDLFAVAEGTPDVKGRTKETAISRIQSQSLEIGAVSSVPASSPTAAGKVVSQVPAPGTPVSRGDSVDLAVAVNQDRPAVASAAQSNGSSALSIERTS